MGSECTGDRARFRVLQLDRFERRDRRIDGRIGGDGGRRAIFSLTCVRRGGLFTRFSRSFFCRIALLLGVGGHFFKKFLVLKATSNYLKCRLTRTLTLRSQIIIAKFLARDSPTARQTQCHHAKQSRHAHCLSYLFRNTKLGFFFLR